MDIKHITTDDLKQTALNEGLIMQGCGGDPTEWVSGINELFTESGILLDSGSFKDVFVFEHNRHTNMLFSMDGVKLDIGNLAAWRLASHEVFGGTWMSDYLRNALGVGLNSASDHGEPPSDSFGGQPGP